VNLHDTWKVKTPWSNLCAAQGCTTCTVCFSVFVESSYVGLQEMNAVPILCTVLELWLSVDAMCRELEENLRGQYLLPSWKQGRKDAWTDTTVIIRGHTTKKLTHSVLTP